MSKIPYKVLTLTALFTILTASNTSVIQVFAQEEVIQEETVQSKNVYGFIFQYNY
ncbi:hypothetical protein [Bacillus sp. AR18-7]|uniref:hypothetical protein n=1 Tax=Bacillus sp. AR18-7 TaxID=2217821 RepID=UPI0015D1DCE4|nr:hypothetical protein [Bacillus sp. AR18-7]